MNVNISVFVIRDEAIIHYIICMTVPLINLDPSLPYDFREIIVRVRCLMSLLILSKSKRIN